MRPTASAAATRKLTEATPPIRVSRIPAPEEPPCRRPSFHYKLGEPVPWDGRGRCVAGPRVRETSMKIRASVSRDFVLAALVCQAFWPRRQNPIGRPPAHWGRRPGSARLQAQVRQGRFPSWTGRPVRAEARGHAPGGWNTGKNAIKSKHARQIVALLVACLQKSPPTECGFGSRLAG